jgi:hypothetical protein
MWHPAQAASQSVEILGLAIPNTPFLRAHPKITTKSQRHEENHLKSFESLCLGGH